MRFFSFEYDTDKGQTVTIETDTRESFEMYTSEGEELDVESLTQMDTIRIQEIINENVEDDEISEDTNEMDLFHEFE